MSGSEQAASNQRGSGKLLWEQYGNILEPKLSQTIPMGPTSAIPEPIVSSNDVLIQNHIAESVSSPEKAGVGGSIPSLATIFVHSPRPLLIPSNRTENNS